MREIEGNCNAVANKEYARSTMQPTPRPLETTDYCGQEG
jgi:hypothetical protein